MPAIAARFLLLMGRGPASHDHANHRMYTPTWYGVRWNVPAKKSEA